MTPNIKNRELMESKVSLCQDDISKIEKANDEDDYGQEDMDMQSDECDEKRSYTPEPKFKQNLEKNKV